MKEELKIELLGKLVGNKNLVKELNIRKKDFVFESVNHAKKEEYIEAGWILDREFKTKIRMKKQKPNDVLFEDQVWTVFANLGFKYLNKDRNFNLPFDKNGNTQQIDVFALDDEAILIIECKAAYENKRGDFKKDLEAMKEKMGGLRKSIQQLFPDSKKKFKFILATKNYAVGQKDMDRLDNIGGVHFDEETIQYYHEMYKQVGLAARYQLLGALFEGQEIPEIDNKIPAIKGKMGSHTYYSFSIEPEKLLKIGYVLHRNKANSNMMPTYQRIIKRSRLKSVSEFIDNGGYFPNSIIISIDSGSKRLNFDRANTQVESSIANIGILHLPKKYRSAFIIDGQHRLYGYSNTVYKETNSIPVVAFENLDREEQVKLFMQINENQKAVPKNLRNTLNADLLWTSDNYLEQMRALQSRISIELGESRESSLYDRILIGENKKSKLRCVTTDTVIRALKRGNFLGEVSKNKIEKLGTFYSGDLEGCFDKLKVYLIKAFSYLAEQISLEWKKGEDGIAAINKGIYSQTMLFSDIVDHLLKNRLINTSSSVNAIFEESKTFIDPIIHFYNNLLQEQADSLKSRHGSGGDLKYWRTLQEKVRDTHNEFNPDGLDEYLKKEAKEYNEKSFAIIRDIEQHLQKTTKEVLETKFEKNWWKKGVPPDVYEKAESLASKKNREIENEEDEVTSWDCLHLIDYRKIALKNWQGLFDDVFVRPGEEKIRGGKDEKTKWLVRLERIRNENFHSYSVSEEEYDFLCSLQEWLLNN